jgi:hypothetical protein
LPLVAQVYYQARSLQGRSFENGYWIAEARRMASRTGGPFIEVRVFTAL